MNEERMCVCVRARVVWYAQKNMFVKVRYPPQAPILMKPQVGWPHNMTMLAFQLWQSSVTVALDQCRRYTPLLAPPTSAQ